MPKIWKSDSFASLAFKSKNFAQILKKFARTCAACPCVLEALFLHNYSYKFEIHESFFNLPKLREHLPLKKHCTKHPKIINGFSFNV